MTNAETTRQRVSVGGGRHIRRPAHGLFVTLLLLTSCTASRGPLVVTNPDPTVKIPAIEKAVREHDRSAIPQLVKDLDNDDAAVRLYANHALHELTGKDFGFKYFAGDEEREAAAERWRQWLKDRQGQQAPPRGNTGTAGSGGDGGNGGGERSGSSAGFRAGGHAEASSGPRL